MEDEIRQVHRQYQCYSDQFDILRISYMLEHRVYLGDTEKLSINTGGVATVVQKLLVELNRVPQW